MAKRKQKRSKSPLVIGFCVCKNCGWSSGKFNWHTYFKCPECGCEEYVKENIWGEYDEPETKEIVDDRDMLAVSGGCRECDLSWLRE